MNTSFEKELCSILVKNKVITLQDSLDLQESFQKVSETSFDNFFSYGRDRFSRRFIESSFYLLWSLTF